MFFFLAKVSVDNEDLSIPRCSYIVMNVKYFVVLMEILMIYPFYNTFSCLE